MSVLWIDAVCIDQENLAERNRQIPRMHQLYEMADGVLIWLGDADEDSNVAMDFIVEFNGPELTAFKKKDGDRDGQVKLKWSKRLARGWAAVYGLLLRPYFRRLWVVQEVAVASVPTAFCGPKAVCWGSLHNAALCLTLHEGEVRQMCEAFEVEFELVDSSIVALVDSGSGSRRCQNEVHPRKDISLAHKFSYHRQMIRMNKPLSFLFLALLNRDAECADQRDKIYALWNLARDAGELGLKPDYALSVRKLYITFTKQYILHHASLDIICAPQVRCKGLLEGGEYLPSWCPDWRARSHVNSFLRPEVLPVTEVEELGDLDVALYRAARDTKVVASFFDEDEVLVCAGMILDEIVHVSGASDTPHEWFAMAQKHCRDDDMPLPAEKVNRDFWSMMFGDATSSWMADGEGRITARGKIGHELVRKTAKMSPGRVLSPTIRGRKLVVTKKGFLALVPYWVQVGDELAVLLGCSMSVVLSRCGSHYQLKGDCFVQG